MSKYRSAKDCKLFAQHGERRAPVASVLLWAFAAIHTLPALPTSATAPQTQKTKQPDQKGDTAPLQNPKTGTLRSGPIDEQMYAWIPTGKFDMGCSPKDNGCDGDEKPAHPVTITTGFWIGQTDVTATAYEFVAGARHASMPPAPDFNSGWKDGTQPMVNVTWNEASAWCAWAGGRLPTEAEWEYAARAGDPEAKYGELDAIAWHRGNAEGSTHQVAQKQSNAFGLYDMLGNVWQWVEDWYGERYYSRSPARDPTGPSSGQFRVLRGGSWDLFSWDVRVSNRVRLAPDVRYSTVGFRCVLDSL